MFDAEFHPASDGDARNRYRRRLFRRHRKKGMATVEFAICLPLLFLIIFGSIEACNMIFLKQALTEAAYQGAMVAMKYDATETDVSSRVQAILDARNIAQTTIDIANGNFSNLSPGDVFTVRVNAQTPDNRISPAIVPGLSEVESVATAIKQ